MQSVFQISSQMVHDWQKQIQPSVFLNCRSWNIISMLLATSYPWTIKCEILLVFLMSAQNSLRTPRRSRNVGITLSDKTVSTLQQYFGEFDSQLVSWGSFIRKKRMSSTIVHMDCTNAPAGMANCQNETVVPTVQNFALGVPVWLWLEHTSFFPDIFPALSYPLTHDVIRI